MAERISGKSIQQLATEYRIPARAIEQSLEEWETAVIERLRAEMLQKLAPMVMAVYEQQLRLGSLDAARDLGLTLGLLRKEKTVTLRPAQAKPQAITSVDDYRLARQSRRYGGPPVVEDALDPAPTRRITTGDRDA